VGNVLNDFLGVEHNADGTLKIRAELDSPNGIAPLDGSGKVPYVNLPVGATTSQSLL